MPRLIDIFHFSSADFANMERFSELIENTLSCISTTSSAIARFVRSVRSAHADLSSVARALSDLRLILELLRDERGTPSSIQLQGLVLLDACGETLVRIDVLLAQHPGAADWASGDCRDDLLRQQAKIGVFQKALALVLEVVTL